MNACCKRCSTPITQRNGVGRKREYCSRACKQLLQYRRTTSVNTAHYNELRAMGGYPIECRAARSGGAFERLKLELHHRRQLG